MARWCNQPNFFKKKSFREFCLANQAYKKNQDTNGATYQSMLDFEEKFPEIAAKYFDLRFDQENLYAIQYGYETRFVKVVFCKRISKEQWGCHTSFSDKKHFVLEGFIYSTLNYKSLYLQ